MKFTVRLTVRVPTGNHPVQDFPGLLLALLSDGIVRFDFVEEACAPRLFRFRHTHGFLRLPLSLFVRGLPRSARCADAGLVISNFRLSALVCELFEGLCKSYCCR